MRNRNGPVRVGDRVLRLDGTTEVVEALDPLRDQVVLTGGRVSAEDLDALEEPDLADPVEVEQFLGHEWRVGERSRFDSITSRCSNHSCACDYCYRVIVRVDGLQASSMHYVDAPICQCTTEGCACAR